MGLTVCRLGLLRLSVTTSIWGDLGQNRVKVMIGWGFPQCEYWKKFRLELSSHCRTCMLIRCDDTLDPLMHRCVDCTKVMTILFLAYMHFLE